MKANLNPKMSITKSCSRSSWTYRNNRNRFRLWVRRESLKRVWTLRKYSQKVLMGRMKVLDLLDTTNPKWAVMEVGEATRFRILTPKRIQAFKIITSRVMKMKNNLVHLPLSRNNSSSSSINLMFNPNKTLKINRTSNSKASRKKVLNSLINYHTVT